MTDRHHKKTIPYGPRALIGTILLELKALDPESSGHEAGSMRREAERLMESVLPPEVMSKLSMEEKCYVTKGLLTKGRNSEIEPIYREVVHLVRQAREGHGEQDSPVFSEMEERLQLIANRMREKQFALDAPRLSEDDVDTILAKFNQRQQAAQGWPEPAEQGPAPVPPEHPLLPIVARMNFAGLDMNCPIRLVRAGTHEYAMADVPEQQQERMKAMLDEQEFKGHYTVHDRRPHSDRVTFFIDLDVLKQDRGAHATRALLKSFEQSGPDSGRIM